MNPSTIEIVKSTVPLLKESGVDITKHFYKSLFIENPGLKDIFNMASQENGRQQSTLASSIFAYASNIDKLEALGLVVDKIAAKHFSLDILPEHYPIVGRNLLKAIREVLGEEIATDEVIAAWGEAYEALASIFIDTEKSLYAAAEEGMGWSGFKDFRVTRKVKESSEITSFYLQPVDGRALPNYKPGQSISVKIQDSALANIELRQYSLSDAYTPEHYRISVKQEKALQAGVPDGVVSNYLHTQLNEGDIVPVHAPGGHFFLDDHDKPVVLISGGVGITPVLSMLNHLALKNDQRSITWLHGTRNKGTHAFREHINGLNRDLPNLTTAIFYDDIENAIAGEDYTHQGYITTELLKEYCALDAEFYFCGPVPFMNAIHRQLKALNVDDAQLHYEVFGPSEALL